MTGEYFQEAINTLNASWLENKLVKLFGKKSIYYENGSVVVLKKFRNKRYLVGYYKQK